MKVNTDHLIIIAIVMHLLMKIKSTKYCRSEGHSMRLSRDCEGRRNRSRNWVED